MNFSPADIRTLVGVITGRTGDPVRDEDLIQEASLRAVEAFRNRMDIRHPKAFLAKVVENAVSNYWRKLRRHPGFLTMDGEPLADALEPEDILDRSRQLRLLRKALAYLDENKRATIELFYTEDRRVAEIALLQQKSVSAVKMDLLRSRRRLHQLVNALAKKAKKAKNPVYEKE